MQLPPLAQGVAEQGSSVSIAVAKMQNKNSYESCQNSLVHAGRLNYDSLLRSNSRVVTE